MRKTCRVCEGGLIYGIAKEKLKLVEFKGVYSVIKVVKVPGALKCPCRYVEGIRKQTTSYK